MWQVPHHSGIRKEAQLTHRQSNTAVFLEQQLKQQVKELSLYRKDRVELEPMREWRELPPKT